MSAARAIATFVASPYDITMNDLLRLEADHERRIDAMASFIVAYEAEHGEITAEEMRTAAARARARGVTARAVPPPSR